MANRKPIVTESNDQGCMLVVSHKLNQDGYFRKFTASGKAVMWHRQVYQDTYGEIPEGYEVDHMCRNRSCINPEHLQLLTSLEHTIKTNKERYRSRQDAAKEYWLKHKCTGVSLSEKFEVSFSAACKWIRNWKKESAETIRE